MESQLRPGFDEVGTQDEGLSSLKHHVHAEFSVHVRQSVSGEHSSDSCQHHHLIPSPWLRTGARAGPIITGTVVASVLAGAVVQAPAACRLRAALCT